MPRSFQRADGSLITPEDPDPEAMAAELIDDIENDRLKAGQLQTRISLLRYADRQWVARSVHESEQYQNGGSHPNTISLHACGICSRLLGYE